MYRHPRRPHALTALGVLLALTATGCGNNDADDPTAAPTIETVTVTATETVTVTATPSPDPTEAAPTPTETAPANPSGPTLGPWPAPSTPGVSVVAKGWRADDDITYGGVVLYNNGPTLSSLDATVHAKIGGQIVDSSRVALLTVPANSFIVEELAFLDLAPGATFEVVEVKSEKDQFNDYDLDAGGVTAIGELPKTRNNYGNVPVTLINPGSDTLPSGSEISVLVLDANDTIIASGSSYSSVEVGPGETVADLAEDVWIPAGSASVVVSVDHLSYGDE